MTPERGWQDWIGPYVTWTIIGAVLIVVGVLPIWV